MGGQVVEVKLGFKECFEQYNQNLNAQKVKIYFCCIICRSMVIWPSQEWPNWDWLRKIEWIADGSIAIVMHGITFYAKNTKQIFINFSKTCLVELSSSYTYLCGKFHTPLQMVRVRVNISCQKCDFSLKN